MLDWRRFERAFERVIGLSALFGDAPIAVDVIVNPYAGRFSSERRAAATLDELDSVTASATTSAAVAGGRAREIATLRFHHTQYVGHARKIAREAIGRSRTSPHIVVSAGGDGTHGEVLAAYLDARAADTSLEDDHRCALMRLPLGTGNDGADAQSIAEAVTMLRGAAEVRRAGHLVIRPTGMDEFFGFNIASIGLDAYVAELTNRLKRRFGGDLYKVIADVATLFYEQIVGVESMTLEVDGGAPDTERLTGEYMLVAAGVSGYRYYGGGKAVLPGAENLCAIARLGLLGKIRLKSLFYTGDHVREPNVAMRSFRTLRVEYGRRIPMQVDGETAWLEPTNFPLRIERVADSIPVLASV